ncbi:two-component system sensor histidine kinase NtrB [Desulfospira joergensenii]|uniref:two-component system sensor histidine kinase NtrB n=1 Tax=Desulfospira joergensenii TaxID=53329 RepID=UPI0003B5F1B6|nr:ATP-binding protein [Desulfospira joergensenii]
MTNKKGLYLSISAVILICLGISVSTYKTASHMEGSLTNEFHEASRHSGKLQLDVLKFQLCLEIFSNHPDRASFENLAEGLDLMFLRLDVVNGLISRLDPEEQDNIQALSKTFERIDAIVLQGEKETFNGLDRIRSEIQSIQGQLQNLNFMFETIAQTSISDTSHALYTQAEKTIVFLLVIGLTLVGVIALYYKQKTTSVEMKQLRNYLSNIINSMPSMLIGVDRRGRVTQWNLEAQKITGLSREKALGRLLPEAAPMLAKEMDRVFLAIETGQKQINLKSSRTVKDRTLFEDVTIFPLISRGVTGAVIRVDDITEKVRMEELVVQSEKMLSVGGLAAGMAHEINNPLAGMIQSANVLARRLSDNFNIPANQEAAQEAGTDMEAISRFMEARGIPPMIRAITTSGSRMAKIIKNMLSFARQGEERISFYSLSELMEKTLELAATDYDLKKKYDFKQIRIIKKFQTDLPRIPCEGAKIQQVLLNLLINGAQAMQEAKTNGPQFILRIRLDKTGETVSMEIEDNGPGMDEKTRKRVFEPFFTTKPVGVGTGLGLSVSYFIIRENHQGEMRVESKPGAGTKFIVRLPKGGKSR